MSVAARDAVDEAWPAYWAALEAGDAPGALDVATGALAAGARLVDVLDRLVAAAQREVGRRWAAAEWNVAQEHRATATSEDVLAALTARRPASTPRGRAVVCCVDGEWHALPARLVAAVWRDAGWDVHHLGASVPAAQLVQYLHDVGPDVIGLSCSVATALPLARGMIEASRTVGVPVLAGGPGFGPDGRWGRALGADGVATDARAALAVLTDPGWRSFTTPAPPLGAPGDAAARMRRHRGDLAAEVERRVPGLPDGDAAALVDFAVSAVLVDDAELLAGAARWLADVHAARMISPAAVPLALDVLATLTAAAPVAGAVVDAARRSYREGTAA